MEAIFMGTAVSVAAVALVLLLKELLFPSDDSPPPTCCRCGGKVEVPDECMFLLPGPRRICGKCVEEMLK